MKNRLQFLLPFALILSGYVVNGQAIVTSSDSIVLKRDTSVNLILQKHRGQVQWQISSGGSSWSDYSGKTKDTLLVNTEQAAKYRAKIAEGTCQPLFTDPVSIVFIIPSVITDTVRVTSQTTAETGGTVTADGGTAVTARGICWSATQNPTVAGLHTNNGTGTGKFTSNLTGLLVNTRYYVRAYATNSSGTAYGNEVSFKTPPGFICGLSFTVNHIAGAVAPVSKSVMYGTVTNIPGEPLKCWITKNLGADRQANTVDDHDESSAGWFWQFNRKQGYRNDGTTRTPNTAWDANISEDLDWQAVNDPCAIELGTGWRIPTLTEWENVNGTLGGKWTNWNNPWNSALKLHGSGLLKYTDGSLYWDSEGEFWSSKRYSAASGWVLEIKPAWTRTATGRKSYGYSVRCVMDCSSPPKEPVPVTPVPSSTQIIWTWKTVSGATGYKVNYSSDFGTAYDIGTDTTITETGLSSATVYTRYIWAYNVCGHSGPVTMTHTTLASWTCGTPITVNHVAGSVAPVSKMVTYGTVNNIPGDPVKCWITKNLGADRQALDPNDGTSLSAGWYWQFNRKQGYTHDGVSATPGWTITSVSENSNWAAANDPCSLELGSGWHIPTYTEWINVDGENGGNWTNRNGPWNSPMKLHAAGCVFGNSGALVYRGQYGFYWSNTTQNSTTVGWSLYFDSGGSSVSNMDKATGFPVRCVKDK